LNPQAIRDVLYKNKKFTFAFGKIGNANFNINDLFVLALPFLCKSLLLGSVIVSDKVSELKGIIYS